MFVKSYGFLSFAKNWGKNIGKNISKTMSGKHSQILLNHARQSATDALEITSKRPIQEITEATSDLLGNKLRNAVASDVRR